MANYVWVGGAGNVAVQPNWVVDGLPATSAPGPLDWVQFSGSGDLLGNGSYQGINFDGSYVVEGSLSASQSVNLGITTFTTVHLDPVAAISANFIDLGQGAAGELFLDYAASVTASSGITVGDTGFGYLEVEQGSDVTTQNLDVAWKAGGEVTVFDAELRVGGYLTVGDNAYGSLSLAGGGQITVSDGMTIGNQGAGAPGTGGSVDVSGMQTRLDAGASVYGLSVGAAGSGSLTVEQNGAVLAGPTLALGTQVGGSGQLLVETQGSVTAGWLGLGSSAGATGTATVDGAFVQAGSVAVGTPGSGTLTVQNGGSVEFTGGLSVANGQGSEGVVTVTGLNSVLDGGQSQWGVTVGSGGGATLTVSDGARLHAGPYLGVATQAQGGGVVNIESGGQVDAGFVGLGEAAGSLYALATVDGPGSTLSAGNLTVGDQGGGGLHVQNGGTVTAAGVDFGYAAGVSGGVVVTGQGSSLTASDHLTIGDSGHGSLTIQGGASVTALGWVGLGAQAGSDGTLSVRGAGTVLDASRDPYGLTVGNAGTGELDVGASAKLHVTENTLSVGGAAGGSGLVQISSGGVVDANWVEVGAVAKATGSMTLDGAGTSLTVTNNIAVGSGGDGATVVENHASLTAQSLLVGYEATSHGDLTVLGPGSNVTVAAYTTVGQDGVGQVEVETGGAITTTQGVSLGGQADGSGAVTVTGAGSTFTDAAFFSVGDKGLGVLNVEDGAEARAGSMGIGNSAGASGTVALSGSGSLLDAGAVLTVGNAGKGELDVENGATVTASFAQAGVSSGGGGAISVDGAGSSFQDSGNLTLGNAAQGVLTVENGAHAQADSIDLGWSQGGSGEITLTGAGSNFHATNHLTVGDSGDGVLQIEGGATALLDLSLNVAAQASSTGKVLVTGAGSLLDASHAPNGVIIGQAGEGSLTVSDAGEVTAGAGLVAGAWGDGTVLVETGGQVVTNFVRLGGQSGGSGLLIVEGSGSKLVDAGAFQVGTHGTGTLDVEAGGSVSIAGDLTLTSGAATVSGTDAALSVGSLSGAGLAAIGAGGLLSVAGASSAAVQFFGAGGELQLASASQVSGVIAGFGFGDLIDLQNVDVASWSWTGSQLDLTTSAGASFALNLSGLGADAAFSATSDGAGGTDIRRAPSAPSHLADAAVVNGYVNAAHDTSAQALSGIAGAGETVSVFDEGKLLGSVTADANGGWSFTLGALADGDHSLTAQASGSYGASPMSTALAFVVDTHPPAAPSSLADAAIVNGYVNKAGDTAAQALTGTAEAGATVSVYDGAQLLGVTTAGADGVWSFTLGDLPDGAHSLTATATDAAGNVSPASGALAFSVDTVAPHPAIIDVTMGAGATVVGTSDPGGQVSVYDGKTLLGTATADAHGEWSLAVNAPGNVIHAYTVTATDEAGNTGASSGEALFTPAANKALVGGAGDDVLIGRPNDLLTGGAGHDTFVFNPNFGRETVTDFTSDDRIAFDHTVFADFSSVMAHAAQVGADTVITYDHGDTVTLKSVLLSSLSASEFTFI